MSESILIALISLGSSIITGIITAIIGPVIIKLLERTSTQPGTTTVVRPWWQFAFLGAIIGALITTIPLLTYTNLNPNTASRPIRENAVAYYSFDQPEDLELWSLGEGASPNQKIEVSGPGFSDNSALTFSAPISSTEQFDLHAIHVWRADQQTERSLAGAIIARVRWPEIKGVKIKYAVLCVRPDGGEYICEGLPQTPGQWQTLVFNLRHGGDPPTDATKRNLLGLAILAKFEKTSSDAPLLANFQIDDIEVWVER
ncbi:hypothetical protein OSCT_1674 [Oscillochloris trichoides DG-6]|uniref:Uncharacterized protein n=1 Tax=Oscillochloris trichoides DG-6 TaxID=765420 RepID=E1IEC3_9CHLR|nr:hypothetical protein [Oscillochloris trichoides]EFO80449.1 hypothetical protein OSCT_1674 [Oscillochloris trichoides DG-6]